jgi:beta-phosphoglucomutase-like phosphatase (HAD superfamily)
MPGHAISIVPWWRFAGFVLSAAHSTLDIRTGSQMPLRLVIFDCDGVLIDSEALCDRVVSAELARQGWHLSPAECHQRFLGLTFADIQTAAERHLGRSLGENWLDHVVKEVTTVMANEVEPIPGAADALKATTTLGLPFRIASNSSRLEMAAKFNRTGLDVLISPDRIHSAYDLFARSKKGKPAPDLFLDAADAENVPPKDCVVIEDSLAGVTGAIAAGMRCLAYVPDGDGAALTAAGARPFQTMAELPQRLDALRREIP